MIPDIKESKLSMSSEWKQGLCYCCGLRKAENNCKSIIVLACILPCFPILILREETRERYNIERGPCDDVMASVSCTVVIFFLKKV